MKGKPMKQVIIVHAVLFAVIMAVLLAGCSSTPSVSNRGGCPVKNEVMLAGYQAGELAASGESLGTEISMPLWFISGD